MSAPTFDRAALNRMYRYCFSLTNNEDAAYDLLQDGLERYLRASREGVADTTAFLRRIIRNRFIDGLRDRDAALRDDREPVDPDCLAIGFSSLDDVLVAEQDLERIWGLLDPFERELLHLWALEGHTAREVADQLGAPLGTVLARIHRMRRKISRHLDRQADGSDTGRGAA